MTKMMIKDSISGWSFKSYLIYSSSFPNNIPQHTPKSRKFIVVEQVWNKWAHTDGVYSNISSDLPRYMGSSNRIYYINGITVI